MIDRNEAREEENERGDARGRHGSEARRDQPADHRGECGRRRQPEQRHQREEEACELVGVDQRADRAEGERHDDDAVGWRETRPEQDRERGQGEARRTRCDRRRELIEKRARVEQGARGRPQRGAGVAVLQDAHEAARVGRCEHPNRDRQEDEQRDRPRPRTGRRIPGLEEPPTPPGPDERAGEHQDVEDVERRAERDRTAGLAAGVVHPPAEDGERHEAGGVREQEDRPRAPPLDRPQMRHRLSAQVRQRSGCEPVSASTNGTSHARP